MIIKILDNKNKTEIIYKSHEIKNVFFRNKELKRVIINNKYIIKKGDTITLRCQKCNKVFEINYFQGSEIRIFERQLCTDHEKEFANIEKFGVCNVMKTDLMKKKFSNDAKERYHIKGNEILEKRKKTSLEKYGVESPNQSENVKQNKMNSLHKKYKENINSSFQSPSALEKTRLSCLEKYGVETSYEASQTQIIRQKRNETNIKKFGVDNPWKSQQIKEKIKQNNRKNYYNNLLSRFKNIVKPMFSFEDYIGNSEIHKYKWKCLRCSTIFSQCLCNGIVPRCPKCFPINKFSSNLEKEVVKWLKTLNLQISENNREIINPLELDIYISSKNLAIEFDGLYWHSELQGKDSNYHLDKTTKCKELGIQLLHVWENEWIEKQDIVKSIIKSKLGLYDRAIGGRSCSIKEISNKEVSDFYNINHIQGSINSKINVGLFYKDELVSCLSFSKPRYNKHYQWEITRFANLLNTTVHGSFSKLWNYFQKKYNPESLITYSDKRYFDGLVYKKYFTELQDSNPAYWYIKNCQIYNRVSFQKHKLSKKLENFDSNLTEWENMQLNGYDRIWDCGNKAFVWRSK